MVWELTSAAAEIEQHLMNPCGVYDAEGLVTGSGIGAAGGEMVKLNAKAKQFQSFPDKICAFPFLYINFVSTCSALSQ